MILVTGSSGHLGEALVRTLRDADHEVVSLDITPSPFTTMVGSITDRECVKACMARVHTVYHTATLHKPHVVTHSMQQFVDTNIHGTLTLLEEAAAARVSAFVFTSTTSVFGDALHPQPGTPVPWVTEELVPIPKNIYELRTNAPSVLRRRVPEYEQIYQRLGWRMFEGIDRVYVNEAARKELKWEPKYDFARVLSRLSEGANPCSPIARAVGSKGYHSVKFDEGPYPVEG